MAIGKVWAGVVCLAAGVGAGGAAMAQETPARAACQQASDSIARAIGEKPAPLYDWGMRFETKAGDVMIGCDSGLWTLPPDMPDRPAPAGYHGMAIRAVASFTGTTVAVAESTVGACLKTAVSMPMRSRSGKTRARRASSREIGRLQVKGLFYKCTIFSNDRRGAEVEIDSKEIAD